MASAAPENKNRDFPVVLAVWLLLAVALVILALPNASVPGLFYDEAHCAGMARDFLTGHAHDHTRGYEVVDFCGRPFPMFVQTYGGAVKSWLLLPIFAVFGASQPILRFSALGWGLVSLLLFMLWTWHWLGRNIALLAGVLLALDPTFFFISVLDWGPVLPSFLCRFACFYFALRWWQIRNEPPPPEQKVSNKKILFFAFLAGFFAGLGFFNKIDFTVLLGGVLLALLCCNARRLWAHLVVRRFSGLVPSLVLAVAGFFIACAPMLPHIPGIMGALPPIGQAQGSAAELTEKCNAMLAMYDGSYFYRLMDAGGMFSKMFQNHVPIFAPIGIALILAAAYLVFRSGRDTSFRGSSGGTAVFLLLATLFITIGIFLLPKATRIHHMVLVYPFPQLAVALAVTRLSRRGLAAGLFILLLVSQILALCATQQLIRQTGGRGWWSDALSAFASQVKARSDLTIVSLDWGFNEQLAFLTDGPKLLEPFWGKWQWDRNSTNVIYLLHPPEYSYFPFGRPYLDDALRVGPKVVDLKAWRDHQDRVAFYSLRIRGP
jgi:hypothetical protein